MTNNFSINYQQPMLSNIIHTNSIIYKIENDTIKEYVCNGFEETITTINNKRVRKLIHFATTNDHYTGRVCLDDEDCFLNKEDAKKELDKRLVELKEKKMIKLLEDFNYNYVHYKKNTEQILEILKGIPKH